MAAKEKNLKDHEYSMARSEIKTLKNALTAARHIWFE